MAEIQPKQVRISSLQRFRALTEQMKKQVHAEAVRELNRQAMDLAQTIQSVTPVYSGPPVPGVEPGALRTTVNVVPDRSKDTIVRVVAGGAATTAERGFDYARAVEFGTVNMKAEPFFFPTYRLRKKSIIRAMKSRITRNIKKYSAEQGGRNV